MNSVTLYSNGTAVIRRNYRLVGPEPVKISIPVRKSDLDDVISSLTVFGDVTVTGPPTYTPVNAEQTALKFDPTHVFQDLASRLAGARVEIEAGSTYAGTLLGVQPHQRSEADGRITEERRVLVLTEQGIQQVEEKAIVSLRFTDPLIQNEISKALRTHVSDITPDRAVVDLTVTPMGDTALARLTYATPVAAWKIRYQLRMDGTQAELEGQAVIDNDTDDDWTDTLITTVTGEPITFSTDLAEIRRPKRSRLNIVADQTPGAVVAESAMEDLGYKTEHLYKMCAMPASPMAEFEAMAPGRAERVRMDRAEAPQAEVKESGDFSIFHSSTPVSIGTKRSAIIPLFRTAVANCSAVLFYREDDEARRPFRAIRLRNTLTHALSRGVCEVFADDEFMGKCVLESTRIDEEVLLIHAKDTGVRIFKETTEPQRQTVAIQISGGWAYYETLRRLKTEYKIQNSHPEPFQLEIEHPRTLPEPQWKLSTSQGKVDAVDIPSGRRLSVLVDAKGSLVVTVVEEQVDRQTVAADSPWVLREVIDIIAPTSNSKLLDGYLKSQAEVETLTTEKRTREIEAETLKKEQQRLIKLIPNGHAEQANLWRKDLGTAENELRQLQRVTLPTLEKQIEQAKTRTQVEAKMLTFQWKPKA